MPQLIILLGSPLSEYHLASCTTPAFTGDAMPGASRLFSTLVGKKILMAVTGVVLLLFVVGHLLGNLKVFQGAEHFNAYSEGLRTVGAPFFGRGQLLALVRIVLIASVLVHLWAALETTRASWAARPVAYKTLQPIETTYAARTMRLGGVLILVYAVYHLLDLTFGAANPHYVAGDPYHNLIASLQRWPVAGFYAASVIAVGLHIHHGAWSALQTLGVHRPPVDRWRRTLAAALAGAITIGYLAIPAAVLAGVVR